MRARDIALLIGIALSFAAGCGKRPPAPVANFEPDPAAVGKPASGRAAIPAPATNAQITDEQVRSYVTSHRLPHADAANVSIVSTNLLSHQQVRTLLHSANLGLPDNEQLWLVVMSGTFAFSGPPGANPTFPFAVEVFDAHTGNLLQAGGVPRAPQIAPALSNPENH
jgi:hypothetical protein